MVRFTIRDGLWLMATAGLVVGWWLERERGQSLRDDNDYLLKAIDNSGFVVGGNFVGPVLERKPAPVVAVKKVAVDEDVPQCKLVGPPFEHRFGRTLYRIENIEQLGEMTLIKIDNVASFDQVKGNHGISDHSLATLISSAKPLPPDSEIIDNWHFALPYLATFEASSHKWSATLHPGGLGFLVDEEGRRGAFMYHSSTDRPTK